MKSQDNIDLKAELTQRWSRMLDYDDPSPADDFFDMGGTSIKAMLLFIEIEDALGIKIPLRAFAEQPTLEGLSALILAPPPVPSPTSADRELTMKIALHPTAKQRQTFANGSPDTPVVMLNLLAFKEHADGENPRMTGAQSYVRYGKKMRELLASVGARVIWAGQVDSMVIGQSDVEFSGIALVEYPSRQVFLEVTSSPYFSETRVHRENGLAGQWLLAAAVKETISVCSCVCCLDIASRYNLKTYSYTTDKCRYVHVVVPKENPFSDKTRAGLFEETSIPDFYEYIEYTTYVNELWARQHYGSSQPNKMVEFFCKFVDPIQKYQSGEMWVFEEGNRFLCLMSYFEKIKDGAEERSNLIDFTTTELSSNMSDFRKWLVSHCFD